MQQTHSYLVSLCAMLQMGSAITPSTPGSASGCTNTPPSYAYSCAQQVGASCVVQGCSKLCSLPYATCVPGLAHTFSEPSRQWYTSYHTSRDGCQQPPANPLEVDGSWLVCRWRGIPAAQSHGCNIHTAIRSVADARPAAVAALTIRQTTPSHAMSR